MSDDLTPKSVYAFTPGALVKIVKRLDAAEKLAQALRQVAPLLVAAGTVETERVALEALADWDRAQ